MASATKNVQLDNLKCRICLFPKQNLCPLFRRGLSMKVMKLAEIKMYEGDGLPSSICLDCELEVLRCTNFITRIQKADAKLKEMLVREKELCAAQEIKMKFKKLSERLPEKEDKYQEPSTSKGDILYDNNYHPEDENEQPLIEIEEFNVKQEIASFDQFLTEKEEVHSDGDQDHYGDDEHDNGQPEDEIELNPINHVDIVEDRHKGDEMEVSNDPLGQEEPLIETQKNESDPSVDPLTCMKQEVVPMDIDKDNSEAPGSSSSVRKPMTSVVAINPESLTNIGSLQTEVSKKTVFCITLLDQNQLSKNIVTCNRLSLLPVPDLVYTNTNVQLVSGLQNNSVKDIPPLNVIKNISTQNDTVKDIPLLKNPKNSSRQNDSVKYILPLKKTKSSSQHKDSVKDKPPLKKIKLVKPTVSPEDNKKKLENDLFCMVCNLKFSSAEMLDEHKTETKNTCRVCASEFDCHAELEKHFFNHDVWRCKICREEFYCKKDLLQHRQTMHSFTKVQCEICNKTYSNSETIKKHKKLCHTNEGDCHKCIVCGHSYKFFGQLKTHAIRVHSPYESVECKLCFRVYEGPVALKCHIDRMHLFTKRNAPASCSICGKVLCGPGALAKHKQTHDNTESVCEICGQTLKTKSLLLCHMDTQHPKKGLFKCKICNEEVSNKRALQLHQRKHKTIKLEPVCCEICGKEYKNHYILKEHKKIHSSDRPYKCKECGAGFRQDVSLKQHLRVHSNVGKYKCDNCGMAFKWKQTFDKHRSKCEGSESESDYSEDS